MSITVIVETRVCSAPAKDAAALLTMMESIWGKALGDGLEYLTWLTTMGLRVDPVVQPMGSEPDAIRTSNVIHKFSLGFGFKDQKTADLFAFAFGAAL